MNRVVFFLIIIEIDFDKLDNFVYVFIYFIFYKMYRYRLNIDNFFINNNKKSFKFF